MEIENVRAAGTSDTRGGDGRIEATMTPTPAFTRESVAAWILTSRAAQGLPPTIDDPAGQRRVLAAVDRAYAAQAREATAASKAATEAA